MKLVHKPIRTIVSSAVAAVLTCQIAHAGSFSLYTESSGAAVGNYAAGIAAEAADATTGWYNPAGLVLLANKQAIISGIGVFPSSKLTGTSTFSTVGLPDYVQTFSSLQGANDAFVPAFHFAYPLGPNLTVGLSLVAPFGLSTEWSLDGPVRYAATLSKLSTTTLTPEIGGRINEHMALGAGIDFQYARVTFNQMLGSPAYLQALQDFGFPFSPTDLDSLSYNKGDSFGVGFHAGVMLMFNENHTRLGLNYQSQVQHQFNGYSRLTGPLATPDLNIVDPDSLAAANPSAVYWSNTLMSNVITLPDILTFSVYHDLDEQLALLGSVVYTGWDCFKNIALNRVAAFSPLIGQTPVDSISTQDYRNTWRFAVGANYRVNDRWMVRLGGGYDQTPTTNENRDIRIADSNRWALSIGTHYQARPTIGVDVGYTHLFSAGEVPVNKTFVAGTGSSYSLDLRANGSADLVGAQIVWLMDGVETAPSK